MFKIINNSKQVRTDGPLNELSYNAFFTCSKIEWNAVRAYGQKEKVSYDRGQLYIRVAMYVIAFESDGTCTYFDLNEKHLGLCAYDIRIVDVDLVIK